MVLRRATTLTALGLLFATAAGAQEQPPAAAPPLTPGYVEVPSAGASGAAPQPADPDLEKARAAARAAGDAEKDAKAKEDKARDEEGLERARAAARAADPRLQGVERDREEKRKSAGRAGGKDCLSAREARGAILSKRAITLSQALQVARDAWAGEVIDYKLCTFDGALAYDLTLLNGDGKVARVRVSAEGKLVGVR